MYQILPRGRDLVGDQCLVILDGPLSYSVSGSVVYSLHLEQKMSGVRVQPDIVFPLVLPSVKKDKSSGEHHDKRTLDQKVGSGVNHLSKRTHDYSREGDHMEEKPGSDQGLDQPRRMVSAGG